MAPPPVPPPVEAVTQRPNSQLVPAEQATQPLPTLPQAFWLAPAWHIPEESQQPAQVAGEQAGGVELQPMKAPITAAAKKATTTRAWCIRR